MSQQPHYQQRPGRHRPPRPTNKMAIAALITAPLVPPAGIVLGIVARKQIRRTREVGRDLATVGIVVGAVLTALWLLSLALMAWLYWGGGYLPFPG